MSRTRPNQAHRGGASQACFKRSRGHSCATLNSPKSFGTKKGTVSARAAEIEKACRIRVGHERLCSPEISDDLTFVQLSNGMVLPRRVAREMDLL
jgi:hypothetical protein